MAIQLKEILVDYADRIGTEKFDIGRIKGFEYEVNITEGSKPICEKPYNYSPHKQKIIDDDVDVLLKY